MEKDNDFANKIRQFILLKLDEYDGSSKDFLDNIYENVNEDIEKGAAQHQEINIEKFSESLEKAKQRGEVRGNIKPELVLYILRKLTETASHKELLQIYSSPEEALMAITNYFFKGIVSK